MKNECALVLGGYVNGYSIIQELFEKNVRNIVLFSNNKSIASASNKVVLFKQVSNDKISIKNALFELRNNYSYIIIYPTDDLHLENLYVIYDEIKDFCFIPFNYSNLISSSDKYIQYSFCNKLGIPFPLTIDIKNVEDLDKIANMVFPVLIKPNKREDLQTNVFRNLFLEQRNDFNKHKEKLKKNLVRNITFIASEFIPGDDTNIFAYVGYRSKDGVILNEWTGKKLNQYPNNFGVFSSASNEAPEIIKEQGQKLLNGMDLYGICEPEFKYDYRDKKYKLMEINLRSMMWHRVGNLSGVNIQYTQWLDATRQDIIKQNQEKNKIVHYVFLNHEIENLLFRKKYFKYFKKNVFNEKTDIACFDRSDIKPFIRVTLLLIKRIVDICLSLLKIR